MKTITLFIMFSCFGFSVFAQKSTLAELNQQPMEIRIAFLAMKSCMEQYLTPSQLLGLEQRINDGVKRVQRYCRNKDETGAYKAVVGYSKEPEGRAALTCAKQLQPLLESPSVRQKIGKHINDVNIVLAGGIPKPICR